VRREGATRPGPNDARADPVVDLLMTVAEAWALETGWTI
jgi:hypothetical protein